MEYLLCASTIADNGKVAVKSLWSPEATTIVGVTDMTAPAK